MSLLCKDRLRGRDWQAVFISVATRAAKQSTGSYRASADIEPRRETARQAGAACRVSLGNRIFYTAPIPQSATYPGFGKAF